VLVPSRGRPENLKRLLEAVKDTAPKAGVVARVDSDDPRWLEYNRLAWRPADQFELLTGPRGGYAAAMNELALRRGNAEYLALLADDVLPETQDWASTMIRALQQGGTLGVAYGDDGLRHKHAPDLPTHVVIPRQMARILGWAVLPTLRHLFADNVWRELGNGVGNFPFVDVKLTHLHPWAGKSERDEIYAEANEPVDREIDRAAFEAWRDAEWGLARCLRKLKEAPK
jgi:hypothetical protein